VQFSFMGSPSVPRRLQTGGVYALLRHPQALGNMMFLIGGRMGGWLLVGKQQFSSQLSLQSVWRSAAAAAAAAAAPHG
jgi:protein-S-isoprenylcysteine O-methyltransferase Ste14